jgi:hypothetical protein
MEVAILVPGAARVIQRPELRQMSSLALEDFDRHPVWVQSHIMDYDEPWYEETD